MNNKVATVLGNRPQFIKSVLVSQELRKHCEEVLIHTGQHYDYGLSGQFFEELGLPEPDYNLEVGSGSHGEQTANCMLRLEPILKQEKPDKVLVYGDTNATLSGALTAAKLGIPVAHVEAGPRQGDLAIPEEINRKITDHLSTNCFAPTAHCAENLRKEGIGSDRIFMTGDVMLDNFLAFFPSVKVRHDRFVLLTMHRPLNTDNQERLGAIVVALGNLDKAGYHMIWPIHPRMEKALAHLGLVGNIYLRLYSDPIEPLSYHETLEALKGAELVITDSGGLQKEAFFAGVPCLTLDVNSPWPETVESGWNKVVQPEELVEAAKNARKGKTHDVGLFGDGHAHEKIVEILLR